MLKVNLFSIMHAITACNAMHAITGIIRDTSAEKICQELGLESLKSRFRKPCHFYKKFNKNSPSYLFNLISIFDRDHNTRHNIP